MNLIPKLIFRDGYTVLKVGNTNIYFTKRKMKLRPAPDPSRPKKPSRSGRLRKAVGEAAGWRCEHCGTPLTMGTMTVHHIIPKALAPESAYDPDNCACLCPECHKKVHWGLLTNNPKETTERPN